MPTLLEKALLISQHKARTIKVNNEQIELAFAWLSNKINLKQACKVLKTSSTGTVYTMALALREAYKQNKLIIK